MTMTQTESMPAAASPGPVSWFVALSSFGGLAVLLYAGTLASAGYRIASSQEDLYRTLEVSRRPEASLVDPRFKHLFASRENQAQQAYRVLTFVSEGDLEKGLKTLEGKEIGTIPGKVELRTKLAAIMESRTSTGKTTEAQDALVTKARRNRALYNLLARELRGILLNESAPGTATAGGTAAVADASETAQSGLDSHAALPQKEESMAELLTEPPYYSSGILAGFPVLPNIPDGVADTKALVEHLPSDVRSLLINVSSKQQSTNKRLEDLKARASELRTESQDIIKKLAGIVEEREQFKRVEKRNLVQLQASSASMVRQLALVPVEADVEASYNLLLHLLSRFDVPLPPLHLPRG